MLQCLANSLHTGYPLVLFLSQAILFLQMCVLATDHNGDLLRMLSVMGFSWLSWIQGQQHTNRFNNGLCYVIDI